MGELDEMYRLLKTLAEARGAPGFEDEVRKEIIRLAADIVGRENVKVDRMGNVIAKLEGRPDLKVMLAAHMDEIGLLVTYIEKSGFLRVTNLGGVDPAILLGQRVVVLGRHGPIPGVVGCRPPHLMKPEEREKRPKLEELFIDIGAPSREAAERMGVSVGTPVVLERDVIRLGDGKIVTGKAFDDRVGCAVMLYALRLLKEQRPEATVYAVATVQEEVGCRGARVAAFALEPDMAIAIDVTTANDVPGVEEREYVVRIGKGPAIKIMDRGATLPILGLIAHPKVRELLIKAAEEEGIPWQPEILVGGTTDAATIHLVREGIPSGVVSIPTRYIHSPVELLSLEDAVNAAKLLAAAIRRVKPGIFDEWA